MRLEFDSDTLTLPFNGIEAFENTAADDSSRAQEFLRAGIKAAQAGNRAEARQYLLRVTETEPHNENAWLWLASISEYPEELLIFLNNVLEANPTNERALEWLKATNSLLAVTFVQRGIDAANAERNDFAKQCFYQALAYDAKNENAWLWLAFVSGSAEEKRTHLDKVLRINPANEAARNALKDVHNEMVQTLLRKAFAAFADDRPAASEMLAEVLQKCPELTDAWLLKANLTDNTDERIECLEKILEINPANEAARMSLNSLIALTKNAEPQTESENFQTEGADSYAAEDDEFGGENRFEENLPAIQTEHNNSAPEFEFTQTLDEDDYLIVEKETELSQTEEAVYGVAVLRDEQMSFADETQFGKVEDDKSRVEEREADFDSFTASEEVFTPSYNPAQEEMDAAQNRYQTDQLTVPQNSVHEQSSQVENSHSNEFENEENKLMRDSSPEFEETEEDIFAANDAASMSKVTQPDDDSLSNPYQENNNMLEVENYHSKNNYSPGFDSNEQAVYDESDLMEVKVNEEFSSEPSQQTSPGLPTESSICPFCNAENNAQAFDCETCRAVLSLSNLEMLLANQNADAELLGCAVEQMEAEKDLRGYSENELLYLGIGHINLKNLRQGFSYLQQASQANPNDVLLSSQVNALAIRLEEIERQEEVHDAMPKNRKILVVDDSPTVRKLISGKLEKSGHEVVCAVDGMDALAKLNEVVPDLILLDITMPRMDGYQVCKLVRSNPLTKDIPIVMISGKDGFFDKVRGRMAGTTGYITKPFGPETLMKALDVYIKADGENDFSDEENEVLMEV